MAIKARASISNYCYTECQAQCCRRGYLLVTEKEANLLQTNIKDLKQLQEDKRYIISLNKGCSNLVNNKCSIHKNPDRPKTCKEYPIFVRDKTILTTNTCQAVRENKLYQYFAKLKLLGYTIEYRD